MGPANFTQAWEDFSRSIELNPRNDHAFLNRAIINKYGGREQYFMEDLGRAVQLGNGKAEPAKTAE